MTADIVLMDAAEWLCTLPDGSVDCIITDPPYDTLEEHRAIGTTTHLQSWFATLPMSRLKLILHTATRKLKDDGHLYVICDWRTSREMPDELRGLSLRNIVVWDKTVMGTGYHYRRRHEFIMFYSGKNERKLNDLGVPDVLQVPALRGEQYYPTAKPPALIETLIANSTQPGDLVVDPFVGGGSTAVAAIRTGRRFAGCDISPEAVERTQRTLDSMTQLTLI